MDGYRPRNVLAIDLKSFYASVECVDRNLDPFKTPLVVCDPDRGMGTIVLATSPYLRAMGVPGRCRRRDLPEVPGMIYAVPRMKRYLEKSAEVTGIYLDYVDSKDIHVYSVDESFLDVTDYLECAHMTDVEYAKTIIADVKKRTGLTVCAGIGDNVFMAKAAMDIGAKHDPRFFAKWTHDDIEKKLWPVSPLTKVWGIGDRLAKRLNDMGLYTMGDIANSDPYYLSESLGVIGEEIWLHANGIDKSLISRKYQKPRQSLSVGQVLFFDADIIDIRLLGREMAEALSERLRKEDKACQGLGVWLKGPLGSKGSYSKYIEFPRPLDTTKELEQATKLLLSYVPYDFLARGMEVVAEKLWPRKLIPVDLFTDQKEHEVERRVDDTVDSIRKMFGPNSLVRMSSLLDHSTEIKRNEEIGGHRA